MKKQIILGLFSIFLAAPQAYGQRQLQHQIRPISENSPSTLDRWFFISDAQFDHYLEASSNYIEPRLPGLSHIIVSLQNIQAGEVDSSRAKLRIHGCDRFGQQIVYTPNDSSISEVDWYGTPAIQIQLNADLSNDAARLHFELSGLKDANGQIISSSSLENIGLLKGDVTGEGRRNFGDSTTYSGVVNPTSPFPSNNPYYMLFQIYARRDIDTNFSINFYDGDWVFQEVLLSGETQINTIDSEFCF